MRGQTARNLVLTKFGRLPTKYEACSCKKVAESQHGKPKALHNVNVHGYLFGSG